MIRAARGFCPSTAILASTGVAATLFLMKTDTIEIPVPVLSSVETLDELHDWLTAQNPRVLAELRQTRQEDLAGKFTE